MLITTAWRLEAISDPNNLLVAEEAQYWEWSRRLDWGYYSKPPMIAWLIRTFTELGGSNAFTVRLGAVVIAVVLAAVTWSFGRSLGLTPRAVFFALLAFSVAPLFAAGSVTMTTDTPLMLFWAVALWCMWLAMEGGRPHLWLAVGIALGFGLLSKYTMAFFVPSAALYLVLSARQRHWLRRPHPYLALLAGLLLMSPVIWWNWSRDWVSVRHLAASAGVQRGWRIVPTEFSDFFLSQAGVMSPVLFFVLLGVAWRVLGPRQCRATAEAERFLLCMALPVFLAYAAKSFQDKVQANWTALAYYPWILLAALRLEAWARAWESGGRVWRPRAVAALVLGPAFVITWLLMEPAAFGGSAMRLQPAARRGDWRTLARAADEVRAAMPHPDRTFIVAREYQTAALLAFYMKGQPVVFLAPDTKRRMNQYDLWPDYGNLDGWDAIYVRTGFKPLVPPMLADQFTSHDAPRVINAALPGTGDRFYTIYPCYGFISARFQRTVPTRY